MSNPEILPTNYLRVEDRDVFVFRDQGAEKPHKIFGMSDGSFKVTCTHLVYDEGNIRCQIQNYLDISKKNN
jgi:hypothetical protein